MGWNGVQFGSLTFIKSREKLAAGQRVGAGHGTPDETFYRASIMRGLCKIAALLFLAHWIVDDGLSRVSLRRF